MDNNIAASGVDKRSPLSGKRTDIPVPTSTTQANRSSHAPPGWHQFVPHSTQVSYAAGGAGQDRGSAGQTVARNAVQANTSEDLAFQLDVYQCASLHAQASELVRRFGQAAGQQNGGVLDLHDLSPDALGEVPDELLYVLASCVRRLVLPPGTPDSTGQRWANALRLAATSPMHSPAASANAEITRNEAALPDTDTPHIANSAPLHETSTDRLARLLNRIEQARSQMSHPASAEQEDLLKRMLNTLAQDMYVHLFDIRITDAAQDVLYALRSGKPVDKLLATLYRACNRQLPHDRQVAMMPATPMAEAQAGPGPTVDRPTPAAARKARHARMYELLKNDLGISTADLARALNSAADAIWEPVRYSTLERIHVEVQAMRDVSDGKRAVSRPGLVYQFLREDPAVTILQVIDMLRAANTDHAEKTSDHRVAAYFLNLAQTGINCEYLKGTITHTDPIAEAEQTLEARKLLVLQLVAASPKRKAGAIRADAAKRLGILTPADTNSLKKPVAMALQIYKDRHCTPDKAKSDAGAVYALLRRHPEFRGRDRKSLKALHKAWNPDGKKHDPRRLAAYRSMSLLALDKQVFDNLP